jgi:arylsulfatase A-like enzyme/Flp pilus assembly protein TadD
MREKPNKTSRSVSAALLGFAVVTIFVTSGCRGGRTPQSPAPPRNLLLITVDTLRADALGAYGSTSAVTPWLDRLAAAGARFDRARAHNVVTLPSHANMLTGRLPPDHGIRDNAGFRLAATEETLATRLKARGFRTAAFVSAFPLDSRFGLARGFDVYDDAFVEATPRPAFVEQERSGSATVRAAREWLEAQPRDSAWFCWVHLYEPHFPYAPPAPYDARFASAPYDGEVAATDAALAPLLEPILDAGAATDTLVVVTADHGEALGDHGEATHGIFAYEATLRVPLILYYPPLIGPRAIAAAASHVDLLPTILEALRLPLPPELRGRSLLRAATGIEARGEATYFEAVSGSLNRGWAPLTGVVSDGLKYIDLPIPELYDLAADPAEAHNLASIRPQDVEKRRALLRSIDRGEVRRSDESDEVRERLRSLGYVTSHAPRSRVRYTEADDPKRLIGVDTELQQIVGLYVDGNTREALTKCRALVAQHPGMRVALLQLAHLEREASNMPAAIEALQKALKLDAGDSEAASLLGAYLTAAGRPLDAIALLESYASVDHADVQILASLALAQSRAKRYDSARTVLERALADDPSNARLLVTLGTVELMAGRRPQARAAFESALARNKDTARAHSSLAAMAAEEGRHDEALDHWRRATALDPEEFEKLLAVGISIARAGRAADAVPYFQLFADAAPASRYAADLAKTREWLRDQRAMAR